MQSELFPTPQIHVDNALAEHVDLKVHAQNLGNYLLDKGMDSDGIEETKIRFTDFIPDENRFCITHGTYNSIDGVTVGVLGSLILLSRKQTRAMKADDFSQYLSERAQKTLVHELQHRIDVVSDRKSPYNPAKVDAELRYLRRRSDRRAAAFILSAVPVLAGPIIEESVATNYVLPAALFVGISALSHVCIVRGGDHRAYLRSPSEVSARKAAEEYAGPSLISVTYKEKISP